MSKNKKMKKSSKIIITVISVILGLVIAATAVFFGVFGWELGTAGLKYFISAPGNNFKAAMEFLNSSRNDLETKIEDNKSKLGEVVNNTLESEITNDMLTAIESGKYSEEEIYRILMGTDPSVIDAEKESVGVPEVSDENESISDDVSETDGNRLDESTKNESADDRILDNAETKSETAPDTSGAPADNVENSETDQKSNTTTTVTPPPAVSTPQPETSVAQQPAQQPVVQQPEVTTPAPQESAPATPEPPVENVAPAVPTQPVQPATPPAAPVQQNDTAATIAKLYVVKNKFVTELSSIEVVIKTTYEALPKEQRVPASRKSIAGEYISRVADLELECDAEVEVILAELKTKLESQGKDTSVVDTIRQSYEEEKSLKKAYYMDIYMNGMPRKNKTTADSSASSSESVTVSSSTSDAVTTASSEVAAG